MADAPWKLGLSPASYNGAAFYVDLQALTGGFRLVPHEIPKRDVGWTESMGRRVRHWSITGYLVYSPTTMPDVFGARDALIAALNTPGVGSLVLPTGLETMDNAPPGAVVVDTYSVVERRERGGWCLVEMIFVQAGELAQGQSSANSPSTDTPSAVTAAAGGAATAAGASTDMGGPVVPAAPAAYGYSSSSGGVGGFAFRDLGQGGIHHQ